LLPALAAIGAGLFYSLLSFFTRLAMERSDPTTATFVSGAVGVVVFWAIFFTTLPWQVLGSAAVLPFVGAGISGPFIGRLALFTSVRKLGVSLAEPLYNSQVIFAALGGVIFFSEKVTPLGGLGIVVLLGGLTLVTLDRKAGNIVGLKRKRDLLIPVMAGAFFGASYVLRKAGLNIEPELFMALPVVSSASVLALVISTPFTGQRIRIPRNSAMWILLLAGVVSVLAQLSSMWAIKNGNLAVVIPLHNVAPVFSITLAAVFLRQRERVTSSVVAGVALVVVGATLVNL
jgi:transporter family protein